MCAHNGHGPLHRFHKSAIRFKHYDQVISFVMLLQFFENNPKLIV